MKWLGILVVLAATAAVAGDFRTAGENGAVLYDAPSRKATPLYVVSKYYPLELIVELDAWVKVRDHTGTVSCEIRDTTRCVYSWASVSIHG